MTLRLNGATSGYTEIDAPAVAGNNTIVLPSGTGNLQMMVLETAKASTSGTSVDFTGIPSWVKRITVMFNGVSTNGTSVVQIQLGTSGGISSTNYFTQLSAITGTTPASANYSTGIPIHGGGASISRCGTLTITHASGNSWCYAGITGDANAGGVTHTCGVNALSGTLDRIRITTINGTDTFDAGSINILYEG